jgi:hypothetical protein
MSTAALIKKKIKFSSLEGSGAKSYMTNDLLYMVKIFVHFIIKGGSDNSGTLAKPHRGIIKSYIFLIILHKSSQLFVEAERKTNRHIPAKVNQ